MLVILSEAHPKDAHRRKQGSTLYTTSKTIFIHGREGSFHLSGVTLHARELLFLPPVIPPHRRVFSLCVIRVPLVKHSDFYEGDIINVETLYLQSHGEGVETPILKEVTEYMRKHPSINGKTLAKALEVKRSALSAAIQLLTGDTLNDLMKKWRLLHAMYLLKNSSHSYQEVATQCGFASIRGLSKFLERMIRCTAYEYRKNCVHGNKTTR